MQYLYTVRDVAKILKMNQEVIRRAARQGKLPGSKPAKGWRFTEADVKAYLDKGRRHVTHR